MEVDSYCPQIIIPLHASFTIYLFLRLFFHTSEVTTLVIITRHIKSTCMIVWFQSQPLVPHTFAQLHPTQSLYCVPSRPTPTAPKPTHSSPTIYYQTPQNLLVFLIPSLTLPNHHLWPENQKNKKTRLELKISCKHFHE